MGRHNKTLLDVYLLNSNLAVRIHKRRYGNWNVHFGDDTIAALIAWRLYISSLTWASCVAYPFVMAAKARVRDEQKYDSHVFFCIRSGRVVTGHRTNQTQKDESETVDSFMKEMIVRDI